MKRLLTYLYQKYVLMPELRKMGIDEAHFVEQFAITSSMQIIGNMQPFELDDYHEGNRTIQ